MKILLLEDDVILNELMCEYLQENNYTVDICFDGYEAQDLAYSNKYDLYILDVNVPNITGFEFLKQLRKEKNTTPAIFVTSLHTAEDLKEGFSSGADDYIRKPFELEELGIRINNIKRIYKIEDNIIDKLSNNISFNTQTNELIKNTNKIRLSNKESMILKYFLKNTNKIISIDELCINIWDYDNSPTAATIRTYIKNLRISLEEDFITNIKGAGYSFNKI